MCRAPALALILLCLPGFGEAGAWPRGHGQGFLSLSYEWTTTRDDLRAELFGADRDEAWWEDDAVQELNGLSLEELRDEFPQYQDEINAFLADNPFIPSVEALDDLANSDDCQERSEEFDGFVGCDPRGAYVLTVPEAQAYEFEDFGFTSLYFDYGLSDRLTFGIDAGRENVPDTFQWILFLALAVSPPEWRLKAAIELGAGQRQFPETDDRNDGRETVLRPGLSLGMGFESWLGPSWAALDLRLEHRTRHADTVRKADLTVGVAPTEKALVYLQAQYSEYPDVDAKLRLVPTYVRRLTENISVEAGLLYDVFGDDRIGFRTGLWLEF